MYNKKPPFEITDAILSDVVEIGELVGHVSSISDLSTSPALRCENRIKTIYSSLAIEHFLLAVPAIRNAEVQQLCGVSPATANRILNEFCKEGKLERVRVGRYSSYRKPK